MVNIFKFFSCLFILVLFSCFNSKTNEIDILQVTFKSAVDSFNDGKYIKAKEEFSDLIYSSPLSGNLDDCQFYIAECEFNLKNYKNAIVEYSKYLRSNYRKSSFTTKSEKLIIVSCFFNNFLYASSV